jgi:hypothetical protein
MSATQEHALSQKDIADCNEYIERITAHIDNANEHRDKARGLFTEIVKRKLYLLYCDSAEAFVNKFWGKSRSWLYQQIEVERVQASLPPEVSTVVDNVRKAREIAKVPPKRRMGVITDIQKNGHAVTPKTIRDAAKPFTNPPLPPEDEPIDVKPIIRDATGYEVPEHRVEFYEQAVAYGKDKLHNISDLRGGLKRALETKDSRYSFIDKSNTMSLLNNLYAEFTMLVPHAVCPYCQGQTSDHCTVCRKTGFLPKHQWDHAVPSDLKAEREKAIKKK